MNLFLSVNQRLFSNELMEVQRIETDRINHLQKSTKFRVNWEILTKIK